jgi:hypothetical protein
MVKTVPTEARLVGRQIERGSGDLLSFAEALDR